MGGVVMYLYQIHSQEQFIARERGIRRGGTAPNPGATRTALKGLSDARLISQLEKLRGEERAVQLKILYYLIELEHRRLYLPRDYSSLFEFCTGHLKYSKPAAMRRINAARCIERVPKVAALLLSGKLSLTALALISKILTRENAAEILPRAINKSTRDIDMLVSRHRPGRVTRDRVKPVCVMRPAEPSCTSKATETPSVSRAAESKGSSKCQADLTFSSGAGPKCQANLTFDSSKLLDNKTDTENAGQNGSAHDSAQDDELERVVIEQMFKLEFMVKAEFMNKVERLKSLLSNRYPTGLAFEQLFEILMDDYLDRHSPEGRNAKRAHKATAATSKKTKRCGRPSGHHSRHIPQSLRDRVCERDGGRCTYQSPDGKRCGSKHNLQVDHIQPYARGGLHAMSNLRLLCAKHNRLEAERAYGKGFMKQYTKKE
jgi:5-methylcytosine-specific restriction endonuclease McrA